MSGLPRSQSISIWVRLRSDLASGIDPRELDLAEALIDIHEHLDQLTEDVMRCNKALKE